MASRRTRPGRFDALGLRHAPDRRMLPLLVAAMAFLAALALAGAGGAAALVRHWQEGASAAVTVQVPSPHDTLPAAGDTPEETRLDRALALLRAAPGVAQAHALSDAELGALLRPWLGNTGGALSLPLPAVVQVRLNAHGTDPAALQTELDTAVPGTLVEGHGLWVQRLATLARSLQACAWLALAVVAAVAAAVVMVATRSGLLARRDSIEIVHGLGATDGYIAGRFAARATWLAGGGGLVGALAAVPLLLALASLSAPFVSSQGEPAVLSTGDHDVRALALAAAQTLPLAVWIALAALPVAAALIGLLTAQATVRSWLRRLP